MKYLSKIILIIKKYGDWSLVTILTILILNEIILFERIKYFFIILWIIWTILFFKRRILILTKKDVDKILEDYNKNKEKNLIKENELILKRLKRKFLILNVINNFLSYFYLYYNVLRLDKQIFKFMCWVNLKLIKYRRVRILIYFIICLLIFPIKILFYYYYKFWYKLQEVELEGLVWRRIFGLIISILIISNIINIFVKYISLFFFIYIILLMMSIVVLIINNCTKFNHKFFLLVSENYPDWEFIYIGWMHFSDKTNSKEILKYRNSTVLLERVIRRYLTLLFWKIFEIREKKKNNKNYKNFSEIEKEQIGLNLIKKINFFTLYGDMDDFYFYFFHTKECYYNYKLYDKLIFPYLYKNYKFMLKMIKNKPIIYYCWADSFIAYGFVISNLILGLHFYKDNKKKYKILSKYLQDFTKEIKPFIFFLWDIERYIGLKKSNFWIKPHDEEDYLVGINFWLNIGIFLDSDNIIFNQKNIENNNEHFPDVFSEKELYKDLFFTEEIKYKKMDELAESLNKIFNRWEIDFNVFNYNGSDEERLMLKEKINSYLKELKEEWKNEWNIKNRNYYIGFNNLINKDEN